MDNKQMDGRIALKTAKDQIFDLLDIANKEIDALHKVKRSHEETIRGDSEFIESLHAQIRILNSESYQLKYDRDMKNEEILKLRSQLISAGSTNNRLIICLGLIFVSAVIAAVISHLLA